jgi:hypothetical protein
LTASKDGTRKKAEIIGQDEVAAEKEMPYDTTRTTGKIAAKLITGEFKKNSCLIFLFLMNLI